MSRLAKGEDNFEREILQKQNKTNVYITYSARILRYTQSQNHDRCIKRATEWCFHCHCSILGVDNYCFRAKKKF